MQYESGRIPVSFQIENQLHRGDVSSQEAYTQLRKYYPRLEAHSIARKIGITEDIIERAPRPSGQYLQTVSGMGNVGRMRVNLQLHGGTDAFAEVMEGLVQRNVRAIVEGKVPPTKESRVSLREEPVWRDALSAHIDGVANSGTLAAWDAAEKRVQGTPARLSMVGGVPAVETHQGLFSAGDSWGYDSTRFRVGLSGANSEREGQVSEWMVLALDGDKALPVREIGDAIGRHNAKQIQSMGLPDLYETEVVYKTEGSPELWRDHLSTLENGNEDCETLSSSVMGSLLLKGYNADVYTRLIERPTQFAGGVKGGRLFHAVVRIRMPDGSIVYDDPSARLGMPVPEWHKRQLAGQRKNGSYQDPT